MRVEVSRLDRADVLTELARDAERDGHRMVARLISEWNDATNRFDAPGEALYAAAVDGRVVGVCGLNVDPYCADPSVGRVRRLYVATDHRRRGIASVLVERIVNDARRAFAKLRVRTRNPAASAFYRARGFSEIEGDDECTHELDLIRLR